MTNRWLYTLLALGLAGLGVLLYLQSVTTQSNLQSGFEASCISQNGLLPDLAVAQVRPFCSCAASSLTAAFTPEELDSMLVSGTPSEAQETRTTELLLACFTTVQEGSAPSLPDLIPVTNNRD